MPAKSQPASSLPPSAVFISRLVRGCGHRGPLLHRLLVKVDAAIATPPSARGRPMQIPEAARRTLHDASPNDIAVFHFRGEGAFQAMMSQLIRSALPYPLNNSFAITTIRDYLKSEFGLGVLMSHLTALDGHFTASFYAVLGSLQAVSRAVCFTWLRMVLREVLSALAEEGADILLTVPYAILGATDYANDETDALIATMKYMHIVLKVDRLPVDEALASTYRRRILPLPRKPANLPTPPPAPLRNITNAPR
ncbi:hypothetical protein DFH06DRAFT_1470593 [Mycena polygramma]|nr:hypothetical protein DFH06DRAFT_1470593 [Mycena polygramma]